jgi:exonuclease I
MERSLEIQKTHLESISMEWEARGSRWGLGSARALQLALQPTPAAVPENRGGKESCRLEGERGKP